MPAYFNRCFAEDQFNAIGKTDISKLLKAIANYRPEGVRTPKYALDIHLRERSQIMIYHGGTRLLTIDLARISDGIIRFASKSYGQSKEDKRKACVAAFAALEQNQNIHEIDTLIGKVLTFLATAIATVRGNFYASETSEGYWANRLSIEYGRNWTPDKEWLIIDREAVIGDQPTNVDEFKRKVEQIKQDSDFRGWSDVAKKFGDELDFLAIGPNNQLICIELKHGDNASGICWGPLQTAVYRKAFEYSLPELSQSIVAMARQKIALGLLPKSAEERIPTEGFKAVEGVLAVADSDNYLDRKCWQRAGEVNRKLFEKFSSPVSMKRQLGTWESF